MDAVKEDMEVVGVTVQEAKEWGEMEADDWLWRPLRGAAERRIPCYMEQRIHNLSVTHYSTKTIFQQQL